MRAARRDEAISALRAGRQMPADLSYELAEYLDELRQADFASRKARRDEVILAMANRYPQRSKNQQAIFIAEHLRRYAASAKWRWEKELAVCPSRLIGSVSEYAWRTMKLVDHVLSVSQIRAILRLMVSSPSNHQRSARRKHDDSRN